MKRIFSIGIFMLASGVIKAGWFGPGAADKAMVSVRLTDSKCENGYLPFAIKNGSHYTVNSASFSVIGTIPGRSTEYNVGSDFGEPIKSDMIIAPGKTAEACLGISRNVWPEGSILNIKTEITDVDLR